MRLIGPSRDEEGRLWRVHHSLTTPKPPLLLLLGPVGGSWPDVIDRQSSCRSDSDNDLPEQHGESALTRLYEGTVA